MISTSSPVVSIFFFAVFKKDFREPIRGIFVDHIFGGKFVFAVHSHIERGVVHIRKAAGRVVKLMRRHAEIGKNSVGKNPFFFENFGNIREFRMNYLYIFI